MPKIKWAVVVVASEMRLSINSRRPYNNSQGVSKRSYVCN